MTTKVILGVMAVLARIHASHYSPTQAPSFGPDVLMECWDVCSGFSCAYYSHSSCLLAKELGCACEGCQCDFINLTEQIVNLSSQSLTTSIPQASLVPSSCFDQNVETTTLCTKHMSTEAFNAE